MALPVTAKPMISHSSKKEDIEVFEEEASLSGGSSCDDCNVNQKVDVREGTKQLEQLTKNVMSHFNDSV